MHKKIKANLDAAAAVSKEYFDRKARKQDFTINNLVLLTNTCKANKIQPNFIGPFLITDASHAADNIMVTMLTRQQGSLIVQQTIVFPRTDNHQQFTLQHHPTISPDPILLP
uniref:Uncharacterized protein n=1 Tax=Romanomermis culicivorax TaxID=13658 RepID=A0A915JZZ9_ROMCU